MGTPRKQRKSGTANNTLTMMPYLRCLVTVVAAALAVVSTNLIDVVDSLGDDAASQASHSSQSLQPWQECSIFMAPSSSGGFGVFAARDFLENEIVELAPFFLPAHHDVPFVINSALQDYIYGYLREPPNATPQVLSAIVWGMAMFYNHHAEAPNLKWSSFGHEPTLDQPDHIRLVGFRAERFIEKGEELFSTYGVDDGGAKWFRERHLTMMTPTSTRISLEELPQYQEQYCSKVYADRDERIVQEKMTTYFPPHTFPASRVAPSSVTTQNNHHAYDDPSYPFAIAKVPIREGDRIELAPALVLDRKMVVHSALAPLVYGWHELTIEQQVSVRALREQGYYVVQYQGVPNNWYREDYFTTLEDSVILPVGGWIGRVERVGNNNTANCKLLILTSDFHKHQSNTTAAHHQEKMKKKKQNPFSLGNAGIVLELIATRDIAVGERLGVDVLPSKASFKERLALYKEMEASGQLYTLNDHHEQTQQQLLVNRREVERESVHTVTDEL